MSATLEFIKANRGIETIQQTVHYFHDELDYSYEEIIQDYQKEIEYYTSILEKYNNWNPNFEKCTKASIKRLERKKEKIEDTNSKEYIDIVNGIKNLQKQLDTFMENRKIQVSIAEEELNKYKTKLIEVQNIILNDQLRKIKEQEETLRKQQQMMEERERKLKRQEELLEEQRAIDEEEQLMNEILEARNKKKINREDIFVVYGD